MPGFPRRLVLYRRLIGQEAQLIDGDGGEKHGARLPWQQLLARVLQPEACSRTAMQRDWRGLYRRGTVDLRS